MKRAEWFFRKEIQRILHFIKGLVCDFSSHYTWLSVIVIGIVGSVLLFVLCYLSRYQNFEWWKWKGRAKKRILILWITLCVARLFLRSYK